MKPKNGGYMRSRFPSWYLVAALVTALAGSVALAATKRSTPYARADVALGAAKRMERATLALKSAIEAEGIPIETGFDPNRTGLIGPELTPLTTTLGDLEAKRSTLNPNFAALLVRYFDEAGLEEGDAIAVGASGSFPGLLVATLCAAREMRIDVLLIASFGSSMYGATRPELSIAKIAKIISSASIVPDSLIAVSPGGDHDFGENAMFDDSRDIIDRLALEANVRYILFDPPDLEASIKARLSLYDECAGERTIQCFVNIGGASPNSGTSSYTLDFPQGLVLDPPRIPTSANRGLVYEYAARGIPVVNLLNVRSLAEKGGLPYDPIPLPKPGEGKVYADDRFSTAIVIATLSVSIGLLAIGAIRRRQRA